MRDTAVGENGIHYDSEFLKRIWPLRAYPNVGSRKALLARSDPLPVFFAEMAAEEIVARVRSQPFLTVPLVPLAREKGIAAALDAIVARKNTLRTDDSIWVTLRCLIVDSATEEYEPAADYASRLLTFGDDMNATIAFLFPDEPWATAVADRFPSSYEMLLPQLSIAPVESNLSNWLPYVWQEDLGSVIASLLFRFGHEVLPWIAQLRLDPITPCGPADGRRRTLSRIGSDEALTALLDEASSSAAHPMIRFACAWQPNRAARLLTKRVAQGDRTAELFLHELQRRHPAVDGVPNALEPVSLISNGKPERVPDATDDRVPPVLHNPPWRRRGSNKSNAIDGAMLPIVLSPVALQLTWTKAERELPLKTSMYGAATKGFDLASTDAVDPRTIVMLSAEDAKHALQREPLLDGWAARLGVQRVLALYGEAAEAYVARAILQSPQTMLDDGWIGLPYFGSSSVAMAAAQLLATKRNRRHGAAWLKTFPQHAATGLIPFALGSSGKDCDIARNALRFLDREGHRGVIVAVAETANRETTNAIEAMLSMDPLLIFPPRRPSVPGWIENVALPQIFLKDGRQALPGSSIRALIEMLSFSPTDNVYAGVTQVKDYCDPQSLARFGYEVFLAWLNAAAPSNANWMLHSLALTADDETILRLRDQILIWSKESAWQRATAGLEVLASIGTDSALVAIDRIKHSAKSSKLRSNAAECLQQVADDRGLTPDELADRIVPTFGLDANGATVLDFGSRTFNVRFDESLTPVISDKSGKVFKALPKPGVSDDPARAKHATETWKRLKKDVMATSKILLRRLESAMGQRRRYDPVTFANCFVLHPFVRHVAGRLVWGVYSDEDVLRATFRVAEDHTYADEADSEFLLPLEARIGIVHVIDLSPHQAAEWSDRFGDYEILQPFVQLGRSSYTIHADEVGATELQRSASITTHFGNITGLERIGWRRGEESGGGLIREMYKDLSHGRKAILELTEGIYGSGTADMVEQRLGPVTLTARSGAAMIFGELHPAEFSELVRDIETLRR
jgi:hypothetical protein